METAHSIASLIARQDTSISDTTDSSSEPYTNAPRITGIVAALTGLSALLVVLRCYVRLFVLRRFGVEDGVMIVALTCAFGVLACFIGECQHGLGRFMKDIHQDDFEPMAKWIWCHAIIIVLGISLVKISVGLFLLRFASQNKALKKFIVGSLILFTIACILTLILQCIPVQAAWDFTLRQHARCYSNATYLKIGEFNSSINIVTDLVYATLPVFMFWNIQVNRRTKVSLMGILGLGYFACAAAVVKTVLQTRVFSEPEFYRDGTFLIWNCIELNVGIIAACFPTIKPLVKSIIGSTRSLAYASRSRKRASNIPQGQSSHAMGSVPCSGADPEEQKYCVQIHASRPAICDGGSRENSMNSQPRHSSRIVQTTEVIIQSEDTSEMVGPKATVEDGI